MNTGIYKFQIEKFFISNFMCVIFFHPPPPKKNPHLTKTSDDLIERIM